MSKQKSPLQLEETDQEALDYLFQEDKQRETPITTLGGELQTGKTTTGIKIKETLLENREQPGVVANDIDTGVDAARYELPPELTEDIENICIGCGGIGELTDAITHNEELVNGSDHLMVEPTGKADPEEVLNNLYQLEDAQEDVEVENMLYVLSLRDFEEGSAQALSRVQNGIEAANAVVYSFPEQVGEQTKDKAEEWVQEISEDTATYTIDDIDWQEIREETGKPKRPETHLEESSTRFEIYTQDLSMDLANGHNHQHEGTETVMPVSYELSEQEFVQKMESVISNLSTDGSQDIFLKGFTPDGNVWNYNHGSGEIEITETENGKTPCITNPGEEAGEEVYDQLKEKGLITEEPTFTPGTSREEVKSALENQKQKAEQENIEDVVEERGKLPEDFEATGTYMTDATEAYKIWQDQELIEPAKQQYLNTAHQAYQFLKKEDNLEDAVDEITIAVQAGKILSYSPEEVEELAGIEQDTYQQIQSEFQSLMSSFNESHAEELASREDEADYHEWFAGLIQETDDPSQIANNIAKAYDEAGIQASQPYEPPEPKSQSIGAEV